jgi:hypothetical protein
MRQFRTVHPGVCTLTTIALLLTWLLQCFWVGTEAMTWLPEGLTVSSGLLLPRKCLEVCSQCLSPSGGSTLA